MNLQVNDVVVVPIDFSEANVGGVNMALQAARDSESVRLVHVVQPPDYMAYGLAYGPPIDDAVRNQAISDHFDEFATKHGFGELSRVIRDGDPAREIVDYAKEVNAGLIVIPSHGYHGIKRLLLGSVAERVLRLAECSVLVLKPSDDT